MYTFQAWPALLLGSAKLLVPYQTESDRPGPPATIHGNTFTFDGGRLTWTGVAHCVQFVAALATVVKTWKVLAPLVAENPEERSHAPGRRHTRILRGADTEIDLIWMTSPTNTQGTVDIPNGGSGREASPDVCHGA